MAKGTKVNGDAAATSSANVKKFIGLRVDTDKAEQLQQLADARGISLNELLNSVIDDLQDPEGVAAERVDKGMSEQQDKADDLNRTIDRLQILSQIQAQLDAERKSLEGDKPEGLEKLFDPKRLEQWTTKAKALEEKYKRLGDKIAALRDKVLAQELEDEPAEDGKGSARRPPKKNAEVSPSKDKEEPDSRRNSISEFLNRPIFSR